MQHHTTVRTVLAIVAILSIAHPASARVVLHKSYSSFAIHGHTAEDLDRELAERGPKTSNMSRHPGATQIAFSGNISYTKSAGGCRISKAIVDLKIKIIMPRWVDRRHASPDMALLWDTLSADIRRHEERHAEIALNHARTLDKALKAIAPAATCEAVEARASRVTDSEIAAHDRDQRRFDRVEAINFQSRMMRLLKYHAQQLSKK